MNANDLTFGVELEVTFPIAARELIRVGGYHRGVQIAALSAGWNAQGDGSISAETGFFGVEIVSPVLKGADGLKQVKTACEWLNSIGAKVNRSTGFHVHVGFDRSNESALQRLVTLVAQNEKAIYASTGTHSREASHFCQGVQNDAHYQTAFRFTRVPVTGRVSNRYHVLNIVSNRPTVEFRAFAGTTNATKVVAHVLTCLGLVEKALKMKRVAKWEGKKPVETSPIHRSGEGQTALNRLFYTLGWTKGRQSIPFGAVQDDGLPTLDEAKKVLMRLAKKYDDRAE